MILHGCDQSAESLIGATRFAEQAEARGYVSVFPHVTSWRTVPWRARNCWGFWIDAERRRGEGEVGDLARIFRQVEKEFGTDPERRFVAGLSSGGAMAVALAVAHGDEIRAACAVAGLAYAETSAAVSLSTPFHALGPKFLDGNIGRNAPRLRSLPSLLEDLHAARADAGHGDTVPLLVIQSTNDTVVRLENARMLRDVWLDGHDGREVVRRRDSIADGPGDRQSYLDAHGRIVVETLFYEGRRDAPTHYWPGDSDDPPYADLAGPSGTDAVLDFFERHGL